MFPIKKKSFTRTSNTIIWLIVSAEYKFIVEKLLKYSSPTFILRSDNYSFVTKTLELLLQAALTTPLKNIEFTKCRLSIYISETFSANTKD